MPAPALPRPSRAATALLLLLSLLAALGVVQVAAASPASAAAESRLSGSYSGGLRADRVAAFGEWRGRPADVASDFLSGDSWATIEGPSWFTAPWAESTIERLVIGVPILTGPKGSTTLEAGATGAYNSHFAALGRNLVAAGLEDSVLRLGWEMNGNWFSWTQIGHEAAFAEYFRQIVRTMRAVPGQRFAFEFNPTLGSGSWGVKADAAWPGDAYVDVIGLNVYDSTWGNTTITPEQRWASQRDDVYGLDWWAAFAARHGDKPLGFPEWGLWDRASQDGGGGGDNPYFIRSFLTWLDAHNVLYDTYFNVDAVDGNHVLTDFPRAAEAYLMHFAAGSLVQPVVAPSPAPAPISGTLLVGPTTGLDPVTSTTTSPTPTETLTGVLKQRKRAATITRKATYLRLTYGFRMLR